MRKYLREIFVILISFPLTLYAQGNIKAVKIIKYNKDYNFIVIDQGEIHGLKAGMDFTVIRDGVEVGKIEVVKVKDNVSACDIKEMLEGVRIKEGDVITIYPLEEAPLALKQPLPKRETVTKKEVVKKESRGFWASLVSPFKKIFHKKKKVTLPEEVQGRGVQEILWVKEIKGPSISMDIYADKDLTFYFLREILNEQKIIITHSNRLKGAITAFKMVPLSIGEEIFADFKGAKEKKIVYDINVQESGPKSSKVRIGVKLISYDRKGTPKAEIVEKGKYIQEIQEILNQVKIKAEKRQAEWEG